MIAITWLPLLFLSAITGHVFGGYGLPFRDDIETHVRYLIALPALLIAEFLVHQRILPVLKLFVERGILASEDVPKFQAAINGATRVRNSMALELGLLVLAYTIGHRVWSEEVAMGAATWYAAPDANGLHLTLPGYWNAFVSIPIGQFILFRWYRGLAIWSWVLWRISRLNLRLSPIHPDRAGGLAFLGDSSYAFGPILFAQSAVLAGIILSRVLYEGQSLMSFKVPVVFTISFFVLVILGPLTVFTPHLARARRRGLRQYGTLATSYVTDFYDKWVRGGGEGEPLLGTTDIQSLADLGTSYGVIREMRLVPFTVKNMAWLAIIAVIPMLPLLLTIMRLEELIDSLIKTFVF